MSAGATGTAVEAVARPPVRARLDRERGFAIATPAVLLVLWEVLSRAGVLDSRIYSSPSGVAATAWELTREGTLIGATGTTLVRFVLGTALGVLPGLLLGLVMGVSRPLRAALNPLVKIVYPLPRVALFPLVLLMFGVNERSNLIMIALGPFFAMLITTMSAVQNVDPVYLKVARSFDVAGRRLYSDVVLPAAMPNIIGGLRVAIGLGLLGVVSVEFLLTQSGLGYLIWRSWQILSLGQSMTGLVTAGLLGFAMFWVLDRAETRLLPWVEH